MAPSRRAAETYSPPLSCIGDLRRSVSALAVKVAPAIREEDRPPGCEVEFNSAAGQCREGVLYFGSLATTQRRATILPGHHKLEDTSGETVQVAPPGAYPYDPDPAVVRAHLLDPLCRHLGAWKLDSQVVYLSSDTHTPTPFARAYEVLTCQPFHLKRLRQLLRREGLFPNEIKKRRFPMDSQELRQLLKTRSGEHPDSRPARGGNLQKSRKLSKLYPIHRIGALQPHEKPQIYSGSRLDCSLLDLPVHHLGRAIRSHPYDSFHLDASGDQRL